MRKLSILLLCTSLIAFASCGESEPEEQEDKPQLQIKRDRGTDQPAAREDAGAAGDASADAMNNKGIGPISNVELGEVDQGMADRGKDVFEKNCTACHKTEKRYIGPPMAGVTERRTPEWIMNMILNPTEMIQKDPIAKQLLAEYNGAVMADQNISEEQARAILEYFRTLEN